MKSLEEKLDTLLRNNTWWILTRHFLDRFFYSDLMSPGGEITLSAGGVLTFLAVPGAITSFLLLPKYAYLGWHKGNMPTAMYLPVALGDKYFFITIAMVVVGLVAVTRWEALFPDITDYMVLTPLPVAPWRVFTAKIASLATILGVLSITVNGADSILFPAVAMGEKGGINGHSGRFQMIPYEQYHGVSTHAISVFGASLFIFLMLTAIHGLLLALLGHDLFQRFSPYIQFVAVLWLALQLLMVGDLQSLMVQVSHNNPVTWAFPTLWFLGLYQQMLGRTDPIFLPLAHRAIMGFWLSVGAATVAYGLGYARHLRRSLEASEDSRSAPGWFRTAGMAIANRWLLHDPRERAGFHFLLLTVLRSATHRLYLAAFLGAGAAVALEGLVALLARSGAGALRGPALYSLSLAASFFVIAGLRLVFPLPAELRANWIFRLAEDAHRGLLLAGARAASLLLGTVAMLPFFPIYVWLWGWGAAVLHLLFGLMLSAVLVEGMMVKFDKAPFTCAYPEERGNLPAQAGACLIFFGTYAYVVAAGEEWLLEIPWRMLVLLALAGAVLIAWHIKRPLTAQLIFEEEKHPEVLTLGIV